MNDTLIDQSYVGELESWISKEKAAVELISVASNLFLDKSVELILFRRKIVDTSASEILNNHLFARNYVSKPLTIHITLSLAQAISQLGLAPSRIDLGSLASEWLAEKDDLANELDFVGNKLASFIGADKMRLVPKDVVLYGFGRIGRLAARELVEQAGKGEQLRLRAIVTRGNSDEEILKRASLLRKDSVHGKLHGTISEDLEEKTLLINGHKVHMIAANDPSQIDYTQYGISDALVIDNTGVWRDREGLSKHLQSKGVDKVLLTAPGKGDIPNIVHGVNHESANRDEEKIFSAASCTTNAIVPVLKVLNEEIGIEKGHLETVHAYTNDQNLLDNYHKKSRRGRSAALNMVITETGAAKAVAKVLPDLSGALTGNAVRVPTPDVSLAIMNLNFKQKFSKEALNLILKSASLHGNMVEQVDYSISNELVSSDVVGNGHACVVDGPATIVAPDGKSAVLYLWYDNEYGYTRQVIRLSKYLSKVIRLTYY